ncbi:MAG TPA: methyltransferase domain-containing protein [Alphaproteobacteria bacterium]|nr:methyltransferase domain-containing protein [Alphaproteobacteria bacterium]
MTIENKIRGKIQDHYKARSHETADDHMHIGGKKATAHFAEKINFKPGEKVLDIGCGLGGPARFIAQEYGVSMAGIDLSPDNIASAKALSTGLSINFDVGDGLGLPYENSAFDAALTMHVGMNVPDKAGFYREIARILKPGGRLGVYDVMKTGDAPLSYPLPWAEDSQTSFLESADAIEEHLKNAGFLISAHECRHDFALESLGKLLSNPEISMSDERRSLLQNLLENLENWRCSPCIFIAERLK